MNLLANVLAVIGAVTTVIYAAEGLLATVSHLIRAGIPVAAALQDLLDAVKRLKIGERITQEEPLAQPTLAPLIADQQEVIMHPDRR
ncbi:hypothetical protein Acor_84360 [Acrocarpospora corrugata]|uniref:Uncharacterized protein n=1 Tax=Acrocarpospora corrugata TaxID=35763 RepID=A0A5M3WBE8_9ACTN|nr:hypothetical protein Acor_84360 [Acrocarpospora corrugata]